MSQGSLTTGDRLDLALTLLGEVAKGTWRSADVADAVVALTGRRLGAAGPMELLEATARFDHPKLRVLHEGLRTRLIASAAQYGHLSRAAQPVDTRLHAELQGLPLGVPLELRPLAATVGALRRAAESALDRAAAEPRREALPRLHAQVRAAHQEALERLRRADMTMDLATRACERLAARDGALGEVARAAHEALEYEHEQLTRATATALTAGRHEDTRLLDADTYFALLADTPVSDDAEVNTRRLDHALGWPTNALARFVPALCRDERARERVMLVLALRTGLRWSGGSAEAFERWRADMAATADRARADLDEVITAMPAACLLVWCEANDHPDLATRVAAHLGATLPTDHDRALASRFAHALAETQRRPPTGTPLPLTTPVDTPPGAPTDTVRHPPVPVPVPVPTRALPPTPRPTPAPPAWRLHLRGLFSESWYLLLGLAMVVVGASLLAYYTWDRHWIVRYTIMPALLATFTASLAGLGTWLESKSPDTAGAATLLRGTATLLLPVNFMVVALLADDPSVPLKPLVVPVMAAIYLALSALGLGRWCAAVHPDLRRLHTGTLLAVNSLVLLAPLATALFPLHEGALRLTLCVGFYLGFAAVLWSARLFAHRVLTEALVREGRVAVFYAATTVLTFGQVFLWVHGYLRLMPSPSTYAPLLAAAAAHTFLVEQRALELRGHAREHVEVSFLGYALILLGVLMSAAHPTLRIVTLLAGGGVWLAQAHRRAAPLHHWIGLTLVTTGALAAALLPRFPVPHAPVLALAIAVALLIFSHHARRRDTALADAALGLHSLLLGVTSIAAMLSHWHYDTSPYVCAAVLVAGALLFFRRGLSEGALTWVHCGAFVLPFALPYLGLIDLRAPSIQSSTLVFGLGALGASWLLSLRLSRSPVLHDARSTVLVYYGALAVIAMLVRLAGERELGTDFGLAHAAADFFGPLAMMVLLGFATCYTRSWVPAAMAALIAVVLIPEVRQSLRAVLPSHGHRSGLGSTTLALAAALAAFWVRARPGLAALTGGDRWLGISRFPLRREDASLFTTPLLAVALLLSLKVDLYTVARRLVEGTPRVSTAVAVLLSAVTFTALAIYNRRRAAAALGTCASALAVVGGVLLGGFILFGALRPEWSLTIAGALLTMIYFTYVHFARRYTWADPLLVAPTRNVLRVGTAALVASMTFALVARTGLVTLAPLLGFTAAQLIWHSIKSRNPLWGAGLFVMVLVALVAPALAGPPDPLTWFDGYAPAAALAAAVVLLHLALERSERAWRVLSPLAEPFRTGGTLLVALLGVSGLMFLVSTAYTALPAARAATVLGLALVLLGHARLLGNVVFAWLATPLLYVLAHAGLHSRSPRLLLSLDTTTLAHPSHLAALALALVAATWVAARLATRSPRLLVDPRAPSSTRLTGAGWFYGPACFIALGAAIAILAQPHLRAAPLELAGLYGAATALGLTATLWKRPAIHHAGWTVLAFANVLIAFATLRAPLTPYGLSDVHLAAAGLAVTLLETTLFSHLRRDSALAHTARFASLLIALVAIVLLAANYFVHPDLASMSTSRFAVAAAIAWLAGRYVRRAARHPDLARTPLQPWLDGIHHLALTMALWCVALLIPWLRQPQTALFALGAPLLYFYARAEAAAPASETLSRYLRSATVLGFGLLALYTFRAAFTHLILPEAPLGGAYYHVNAPVILVLSLVLLRLHGLGGTWWLPLYGGLALVAGCFFAVTGLGALSPFVSPARAALVAVPIVHFFIAVGLLPSPLRAVLQRLAGLDDVTWRGLTRLWGACLLVALHALSLLGIAGATATPTWIAPIVFLNASVLLHAGAHLRSPWLFGGAFAEVLIALHVDFLAPSWLPARHTVWAVLGLWSVLVAARAPIERWFAATRSDLTSATCAVIVFGHVLYHHPGSPIGLVAAAALALLWALSSPRDDAPVAGALCLLVPSWFACFGNAPLHARGFGAATHPLPLLVVAATVLAQGWASAWGHRRLRSVIDLVEHRGRRVLGEALRLVHRHGEKMHAAALWGVLGLTLAVRYFGSASPRPPRELALLLVLNAALALAWWQRARTLRLMYGFLLVELCIEEVASVARMQIATLRPEAWSAAYDVCAMLVASAVLAAVKEFLPLTRESLVPVIGTLLGLLIASLGWVVGFDLDVDVALLVIASESLLFGFLGRGRRDSPYNAVAVLGAVGFTLTLMWAKLDVGPMLAYVLPAGLGVLMLVHLFAPHLHEGVRRNVRLAAGLALLGSAGHLALTDPSHPVLYNVVMLGLCLLLMATGTLLRVRMYLLLGFTGAVVDLIALVARAVGGLERGARMTVVALLVLALGVALVLGAAWFKADRERLLRQYEQLRRRLACWE